jgi:hypothetical protein
MFAPHGSGGALKPVKVYSEEKLINWLEELRIDKNDIDDAIKGLRKDGRTSISDVELTEEQLNRYGLGPPGIVESIRQYLGALYASSSSS